MYLKFKQYKIDRLLSDYLIQERPGDYEAYRLLGEVKYQLKDYESSAAAYKSCLSVSMRITLSIDA